MGAISPGGGASAGRRPRRRTSPRPRRADGPGVTDQGTVSYDGLDRRDTKAEAGEALDYAYVGLSEKLSREQTATAKVKQYEYDSALRRLGQRTSQSGVGLGYRSFAYDANGSVEGLEGPDGEVLATDRYRYDPYGELQDAETGLSPAARGNPFRFEGFYYDAAVKTYDMQARPYRPDIGRFLIQDRFESASGDFALQSDPMMSNRYTFASANPVNNIEFDGHKSCTATCRSGEHQQNYGGEVRRTPGSPPAGTTDFTGSTQKANFKAAVRASRAETVPPLAVLIAGSPGERVLGGDLHASALAGYDEDYLRDLYAQVTAKERLIRIAATEGPDWAGVLFGDSPLEAAINIIPIGRGANLGRRLGTGVFRAIRGADKVDEAAKHAPRIAGGVVSRGQVRLHQIHGLEEALGFAKRNGGRIRRDGTPFRDERGLLPPGNYQEWTVRTPGVAGRGARRLVYDRESGRGFYSWNHYKDFVEVVP